MTATFTLHTVRCEIPSSGVDSGLLQDIGGYVEQASSVAKLLPGGQVAGGFFTVGEALLGVQNVLKQAEGLTGVLTSIGQMLPDQLYIKRGDKKVFPADEKYVDISKEQEIKTDISFNFDNEIKLTLWEWDMISSDDFLGELVVSEEVALQEDTPEAKKKQRAALNAAVAEIPADAPDYEKQEDEMRRKFMKPTVNTYVMKNDSEGCIYTLVYSVTKA
ncbi:MAG: hypothetical protein JGK03_12570 [Microcoleus sp. PH2017_25_DOB_D_A]|uniref:hypothetical protein n=1 Tax=unclassified Microcoleus TaxID=2642155 RepID=UPI001D597773|nr:MULTISPECIES: hypothetical protein [unclassified Microcoleus]TAE43473.1 MAG: hypothetical protein EAZ90_10600 [Oscillatoriales cyanobacterium]MCC3471391.1 hypothetical protein [Microcoleus sp. PH2017_13_LAR_U_A]MCC3484105.1 hypothetical protein [Microcoleus sp. PH2017_14_LAR_D_A]MCC3494069.1 hypothetical protein [Microcoleus sp. PH2017_16_JOR_D_A]MCC3535009.1 hypothetical protein [Microcoleus sp. PH2017_25_DOB_D_A]